jgi:hypothetical protein
LRRYFFIKLPDYSDFPLSSIDIVIEIIDTPATIWRQ